MRKVRFLLTLSTLLVISIVIILIICLRHSPDSPATLKVVFNGPFVLVRTKSQPNVITLFSPRDPEGLHKFYSNTLTEGTNQNVHLVLATDGLRSAADLSIDPYFPQDFVADTDVWKRPLDGDPAKDYLVTIKLPLPEKITFTSPLNPVTFENGTQSFQATNFVLEYQVTKSDRIHATSRELNSVSPLSSSALQKLYAALCGNADVRQRNYESCVNVRNLLEQCAGAHTSVLFFGVGIPLETQRAMPQERIDAHAVNFFNLMLQSFPDLTSKRLKLPDKVDPRGSGGSTAMLMETSFRPVAPQPRLRLVTAVIDCKAGNVIVTAKTTQ